MKLIRDNARCCVERLHRFRSIHSLRCVDGDVRGVGGSERTPTAQGVQRDRRPRRSGELGRHYRRSGHGGRGRLLVPAGRVRPHPLATPLQFGPVPANGPPPRQSKDDAKMAAVCAPQADWFFYCSFFFIWSTADDPQSQRGLHLFPADGHLRGGQHRRRLRRLVPAFVALRCR